MAEVVRMPEVLAGAAVFLASRAADYMHGTIVPVDGGWLARGRPWAIGGSLEPQIAQDFCLRDRPFVMRRPDQPERRMVWPRHLKEYAHGP